MTLESTEFVEAANLPANYLPAALDYLRGGADLPGRLLLAPVADDAGRQGMLAGFVDGEALANPRDLREHAIFSDPKGLAVVIGPPSKPFKGIRNIDFGAADPDKRAGPTSSLVVIDAGIGFWNHAFRDAGACRFHEVAFLRMGGPLPVPKMERLVSGEIARICAKADGPGGREQVLRDLAIRFPGSFWGLGPPVDGLWHGTAVADIAACKPDRRLFGVELPASALLDWQGDTLQFFLPIALRAALDLTSKHAGEPTIIVLAFGFPGGPHDGSHAAAEMLRAALAGAERDVKLVLPAGNHLQDRCRARLPAGGNAPIAWRIAPDDHSRNSVEICTKVRKLPALPLTLVEPGGVGATINLVVGTFGTSNITLNGSVIGALHYLSAKKGVHRLRLSLDATAGPPGLPPVPYGDWKLSVASDAPVDLWILRDEHDRVWDQGEPRRGSVFVSADYRERDADGGWYMDDSRSGKLLRRAGTASVLTTAAAAKSVQADEKFGDPVMRQAWYSGLRDDGSEIRPARLVDDGAPLAGLPAVGNGGPREFRLSGTSAAAASMARKL